MGLTEKQVRFCEAYTLGAAVGNATEAAIRAGYKCKDRASASALGAQLLRKPEVQEYIAALRARRQVIITERMRPWEQIVPAAQALQADAIELARKLTVELAEGSRKPTTPKRGSSGPGWRRPSRWRLTASGSRSTEPNTADPASSGASAWKRPS